MKTTLLVLGLLLAGIVAAVATAARRWRAATARLVERLERPAGGETVSFAELDGLPAPVARYLRLVLREGEPMLRRGQIVQEGEFLLRPPDGWRPFTATQDLAAAPPGFVWDAAIRLVPGVVVRVRDGFVDGAGAMRASALGLVTLVAVEGTADIAAGALHRYLAEAVWLPTALLPSQGVRWTPIDDSTARATLAAGAASVTLEFRFGPDGLVREVFAPDRLRDVDGRGVPTPWRGRWLEYARHGGMRIPVLGEVEWILPDGPQPYWRGRVLEARYRPGGGR